MFKAAVIVFLFIGQASEAEFLIDRHAKIFCNTEATLKEFDRAGYELRSLYNKNKDQRAKIIEISVKAFDAHKKAENEVQALGCVFFCMAYCNQSRDYQKAFPEKFIPVVIKSAKAKDVRYIEALGELGPRAESALPVLEKLQEDANDTLALAARRAIAKIKAK